VGFGTVRWRDGRVGGRVECEKVYKKLYKTSCKLYRKH